MAEPQKSWFEFIAIPIDCYTDQKVLNGIKLFRFHSLSYKAQLENIFREVKPKDLYRPRSIDIKFHYTLMKYESRKILTSFIYNYAEAQDAEHALNLMLQAIWSYRKQHNSF